MPWKGWQGTRVVAPVMAARQYTQLVHDNTILTISYNWLLSYLERCRNTKWRESWKCGNRWLNNIHTPTWAQIYGFYVARLLSVKFSIWSMFLALYFNYKLTIPSGRFMYASALLWLGQWSFQVLLVPFMHETGLIWLSSRRQLSFIRVDWCLGTSLVTAIS